MPVVPLFLLFCFAPVFVAAHGMPVSGAITASVRLWRRNVKAFLLFFVLVMLAATWQALPLWIMVSNPFATMPAQIFGQVVCGVVLISLLAAFYLRAVVAMDSDHE